MQKQKLTLTFNFFREIKVHVDFYQAVDFTEILLENRVSKIP